eukprot:6282701-Amphidinium_carterae.1
MTANRTLNRIPWFGSDCIQRDTLRLDLRATREDRCFPFNLAVLFRGRTVRCTDGTGFATQAEGWSDLNCSAKGI